MHGCFTAFTLHPMSTEEYPCPDSSCSASERTWRVCRRWLAIAASTREGWNKIAELPADLRSTSPNRISRRALEILRATPQLHDCCQESLARIGPDLRGESVDAPSGDSCSPPRGAKDPPRKRVRLQQSDALATEHSQQPEGSQCTQPSPGSPTAATDPYLELDESAHQQVPPGNSGPEQTSAFRRQSPPMHWWLHVQGCTTEELESMLRTAAPDPLLDHEEDEQQQEAPPEPDGKPPSPEAPDSQQEPPHHPSPTGSASPGNDRLSDSAVPSPYSAPRYDRLSSPSSLGSGW